MYAYAIDTAGNSNSAYFTMNVAAPSALITVAQAVCANSASNTALVTEPSYGDTYGYVWTISGRDKRGGPEPPANHLVRRHEFPGDDRVDGHERDRVQRE